MYVRITAGKFYAETNAGQPAVNYEVHTYLAGGSTPAVSYSNRQLSVANTNPVVLDSRGEADIFTGVALKLVFTPPEGDPGSPIWSEDYWGEQQANNLEGAGVSIGHNNYTVTVTPAPLALTDRLQLIMTPDTTNADTITSQSFTGTGINDGIFSGPYIGSTSGAVYQVQIDNTTLSPPVAPTAALSATAGIVTTGNHYVKLTSVNAAGESLPGSASGVVTGDGAHKVDVSGIPAIAGDITGYKVYMTKAGGSTYYYVATTTSTTYAINVADASLTVAAPSTNTSYDSFKWRIDAGSWTAGVAITGNNVKQILSLQIGIAFAEPSGHTYGDLWTVTVETPVRVNLNSLGNKLVYKNKGGNLIALEAGDLQSGIAATLVYNTGTTAWILNNPSTAAGATTTTTANRVRKELTTDYNLLDADEGSELSFTTPAASNLTLTLLAASSFSNKFVDFKNVGTGTLTIDAGASYVIKGIGTRYYVVGPGSGGRAITNGVDWHILFTTGGLLLVDSRSVSGVGSVVFTGVLPGQRYRMVGQIQTSGGVALSVRFNADGGTNHDYASTQNAGGSSTAGYQTGVGAIILADSVAAGKEATFKLEFSSWVSNSKIVNTISECTHWRGGSASDISQTLVSGTYSGAADMTSITVLPASGNITGSLRLYQYS